ncbi:hypothetical protein POUND7_016791 [Theobroma cacao]
MFVEMKQSVMMKFFSQIAIQLWSEWELRLMVIVSLALQICLVYCGKKRQKYQGNHLAAVAISAWITYQSATSVANLVLTSLLKGGTKLKNWFIVFWSPFILWHLGSPHNITAYSLEDNDMWLRQFFGLVTQVGMAIYIQISFRSSSTFNCLAIPIFIAGVFKAGERIWALRCASEKQLINSSCSLNDEDRARQQMVQPARKNKEVRILRQAYLSSIILKPLFTDLPFWIEKKAYDEVVDLKSEYADEEGQSKKDMPAEEAFALVGIELSFLYDLFFTKMPIHHQGFKVSLCLHGFCFLSTVSSLIAFSAFVDKKKFWKIDVAITYMLLVGAISLDICLFISHALSKWTIAQLGSVPPENKLYSKLVALRLSSINSRSAIRRVAQHDLISYYVEVAADNKFIRFIRLIDTSNLLQKHKYTVWESVDSNLRTFIYEQLLEKRNEYHDQLRNCTENRDSLLSSVLDKDIDDVFKKPDTGLFGCKASRGSSYATYNSTSISGNESHVVGKENEMIRTGLFDLPGKRASIEDRSIPSEVKFLREANLSFDIFKPLFADLPFQISHKFHDEMVFLDSKSPDEAFNFVEIELSFLYDLLFTKNPIRYRRHRSGLILRGLCSLSVVSVLIVFSALLHKIEHSTVDTVVTYLLLSGAIYLEIYSFFMHFGSKWTMLRYAVPRDKRHKLYHGLVKKRLRSIVSWKGINKMAQHDLIDYCVKAKASRLTPVIKLIDTGDLLQKFGHAKWKPVDSDLKQFIYGHLKEKRTKFENEGFQVEYLEKLLSEKGDSVIKEKGFHLEDEWKLESTDFTRRIVVWHIATGLVYYDDLYKHRGSRCDSILRIGKSLSDYMMYLVLVRPSMLPNGFSETVNKETYLQTQSWHTENTKNLDRGTSVGLLNQLTLQIFHEALITRGKSPAALTFSSKTGFIPFDQRKDRAEQPFEKNWTRDEVTPSKWQSAPTHFPGTEAKRNQERHYLDQQKQKRDPPKSNF